MDIKVQQLQCQRMIIFNDLFLRFWVWNSSSFITHILQICLSPPFLPGALWFFLYSLGCWTTILIDFRSFSARGTLYVVVDLMCLLGEVSSETSYTAILPPTPVYFIFGEKKKKRICFYKYILTNIMLSVCWILISFMMFALSSF